MPSVETPTTVRTARGSMSFIAMMTSPIVAF